MKISKLIEELKKLEKKHGNIEVRAMGRSSFGGFPLPDIKLDIAETDGDLEKDNIFNLPGKGNKFILLREK